MLFNIPSWGFLTAAILSIDVVQAQNKFAVTGLKTGIDATTGQRPARREIRDLFNDVPAFSLYVQAMNQAMSTPETALTSYFQIAGIHGRPYIAWDGVNATNGGGIPIGYCTHGNTLFPTWHRPYLALLEQIMGGFAQTIAKSYNSATYSTAANNLRLPYWDWARYPQVFPDVMTWPSVRINTPTGLKNVTNPLFSYKFLSHPEPEAWFPSNEEAWLGAQRTTLRHADQFNVSHNEQVNPSLWEETVGSSSLQNQVWRVFAESKDYNSMSTSGGGATPAFESPHGTIHGIVGSNGHMSPASFSGFDPAFWLHHANVDRQVALWQAIYPNAWITPTVSGSATWTISYNDVLDGNSPLTPFHTADRKTPWTSNSARYTKAFGYTYPELQDWLPRTPAQLSANVSAAVNKLYNPDGTLGTWPAARKRSGGSALAARSQIRTWSVAVQVPNGALDTGFFIRLKVGDARVGRVFVIATPTKAEIEAGIRRVTKSTLSLDSALGSVDSDDVGAVVSLLREKLTWDVAKTNSGELVRLEEVEGLNILVQEQLVIPAAAITEFPTFGEKVDHPEVTE